MRAGFFAVIAVVATVARGAWASGADVSKLPATDPMTWLVKSVCVDAQNQLTTEDPYNPCAVGIRKLQAGDPLPYHNIEQFGYQQRDALPVFDPLDGKTWIVNTFDYRGYQGNVVGAPTVFNSFNLYGTTDRQSDGYDVIALQDNVVTPQDRWATIVNTDDGGGYQQTFYGSSCRVGDGWVLFPASGFLSSLGGQAPVAIADVYWEQTDQNYPGHCPLSSATPPLTTWQCMGTSCSPSRTGFTFGGVNSNPQKTMDTVVSYHGFKSATSTLEVFYFTREYGMTRWEVWTPQAANPTATPTTECNVPATALYNGVTYVITNCHDWSHVTGPATAVPVWPIPNVNLLSNPHFISTIGPWKKLGRLSATNALSQYFRDTLSGGVGVGYLRLSCAPRCASDFSAALYQDLPASDFVSSASYAFGISVRTDPNQCPSPCSGPIKVSVQQLDARGRPITNDTAAVTATVSSDNGTADPSDEEANSVYLSTAFISGAIVKDPNAATVRFLISPQSAQTFDVLNAWLAAWPSPTSAQTVAASATVNNLPTEAAPQAPTSVAETPSFAHPSEARAGGSNPGGGNR